MPSIFVHHSTEHWLVSNLIASKKSPLARVSHYMFVNTTDFLSHNLLIRTPAFSTIDKSSLKYHLS